MDKKHFKELFFEGKVNFRKSGFIWENNFKSHINFSKVYSRIIIMSELRQYSNY